MIQNSIETQRNHNSNGLAVNPQNINRNGRPKKFNLKRNAEKFLADEGYLTLPKSSFLKIDFGKNQMEIMQLLDDLLPDKIKIPVAEGFNLFLNILSHCKAKNPRVSLDASKFLWEQMQGKAHQSIQVESKPDIIPTQLIEFQSCQRCGWHDGDAVDLELQQKIETLILEHETEKAKPKQLASDFSTAK